LDDQFKLESQKEGWDVCGGGEGLGKSNNSKSFGTRYHSDVICTHPNSPESRLRFDVISFKINEKRLAGQKQGAKEHEI